MMKYNNIDLIDCAIIKVDSVSKNDSYEQDGSAVNYGYNYAVRIKDIEGTIKYIRTLFDSINLPCSRIYLSGFAGLSDDFIWTKNRITEHAINEANRRNLFAQERVAKK